MATVLRWSLLAAALILLASLAGLVWIVAQAITPEPRVPAPAHWTHADDHRGKLLAEYLLVPGRGGRWAPETRRLTGEELAQGLNHLLRRARLGHARVMLDRDRMRVETSLALGSLLAGRHLNLGIDLVPAGPGLALDRMWVGEVGLPGRLGRSALGLLLSMAPGRLDPGLPDRLLAGMTLESQGAAHHLLWRSTEIRATLAQARLQWLGLDAAQMAAYKGALAELARRQPRPDFTGVLAKLFQLAAQRSRSGNPVAENRALLVALAEQVNGISLAGGNRGSPRWRGLRLQGRSDFVEHLTLSAALAVVAGGQLADAAGLFKEISDVEGGGSGFSFTDLAVDRAGSRLGMAAVASPEAARLIQDRLAQASEPGLFLPPVRDLPEFLPRGEFQKVYGGVDGPGYNKLLAQIDQRIARLALYQDLPGFP